MFEGEREGTLALICIKYPSTSLLLNSVFSTTVLSTTPIPTQELMCYRLMEKNRGDELGNSIFYSINTKLRIVELCGQRV